MLDAAEQLQVEARFLFTQNLLCTLPLLEFERVVNFTAGQEQGLCPSIVSVMLYRQPLRARNRLFIALK